MKGIPYATKQLEVLKSLILPDILYPPLLLGELIKTHRIWGGRGREPRSLKAWL